MTARVQVTLPTRHMDAVAVDGHTREHAEYVTIGTVAIGDLHLRFYGAEDLPALDRLIEVAQQVRSEMAAALLAVTEQVSA